MSRPSGNEDVARRLIRREGAFERAPGDLLRTRAIWCLPRREATLCRVNGLPGPERRRRGVGDPAAGNRGPERRGEGHRAVRAGRGAGRIQLVLGGAWTTTVEAESPCLLYRLRRVVLDALSDREASYWSRWYGSSGAA
ncbi:MAG: hypothetical protein M3461_10560 [Pseudomonadota bacterium]|nr:hypothetical protein [Pseudomonadota bacterium]